MKKYLTMFALLICSNVMANADAEPKMGEIVWNELATPDVQRAKDFYGKVFGWKFTDKNNNKDMGDMTYTMIQKDGKEFGGIFAIPSELQGQIPPHWLAYILVENVEKSLEKARQNGATVIKPVQKAGDMGLFAIIQDPVGAHIALWQSLKK